MGYALAMMIWSIASGEQQPVEQVKGQPERRAAVHTLPWRGSDQELLERLARGDEGAATLIFSCFGPHVNRMVWHILGDDPDHDDLIQEVFLKVLKKVHSVREAAKLRQWVLTVTVNTVRSELRRRGVRRRLFRAEALTHDVDAVGEVPDEENRSQLRSAFAVLEQLGASERLAFTLRHVDGQPLQEVAQLCGCSLATIKRRLTRAERRFVALARRDPALRERLERGDRWEVAP